METNDDLYALIKRFLGRILRLISNLIAFLRHKQMKIAT